MNVDVRTAAKALESMQTGHKALLQPTQTLSMPTHGQFDVLQFEMEPLRGKSGLVLLESWHTWPGSRPTKQAALVSFTDLSAAALVAENDAVVWVTSLAAGANLAGVTVALYTVCTSWNEHVRTGASRTCS